MSRALRVLIVEDFRDDAELLLLELQRGDFEPDFRRVETADEMREALAQGPWDLVLTDYTLPSFEAQQALAISRAADPDMPVILVSGTIGEEVAVKMMRAGASDYVLKSRLRRLVPAVERELREAENRRARRRAEQSAFQLAAIVQSSNDAIVSESLDGLVTSWNPAAERLYGWTAAEAVGQHISFIVPPELAAELADLHERARCGKPVGQFDTVRLHKDGTRIDVAVAISPMWDTEGRLVGISKIFTDIGERKRAESLLRLRDRAIQAVSQGILITDAQLPDHPIVYASPGFERLTGYTAAEVAGRNCRFLQGKDTDPDTVSRLSQAIREVRSCTVELLNYKKDGTAYWNELSVSPVRDADGRLTHFVGVQIDVTERRALEAQYRQSQKMEAIGRLAGGIAHDFNNLLTVISGYSELLLNRMPSGDPARRLVEQIHLAGERSASLTRQLLVFSRNQVVAPEVLDLNAMVADSEKLLRRLIGEDVRLQTTLSPSNNRVKASPCQLQQVLLNLAVNARDAMPSGGRLSIETAEVGLDEEYARVHPDVAPGPYVLLAVSDTGCGMNAEVQSRIFEPFFTTKAPGKGTGLGLAVVHGIVKQAGGQIDVHSEPGVGTTFRVYLPRAEHPGQADKAAAKQLWDPRGTETVLLVEDDAAVRVLTRHTLADCGYKVLEASNANQALRIAGQHAGPIHVLVTDVILPNLNGRQLAERLHVQHPETKVLYVSGYTDDEVVQRGVQQAQVQFLQKPFSPAALTNRLREMLDSRAR